MSERILVVPDPHSHWEHDNARFDWLGKFMVDIKPTKVVNLGDHFDVPSLSEYDKGKRSFVSKNYKKDIEAGLDAHERMWGPLYRQKKKRPETWVFEGNHEHRIERALDLTPQLEGTIGFSDFEFDRYYDHVVRYTGGTPGIAEICGIQFAHFFVTGVSGRPVSGERPAHMLINKYGASCIQGHTHVLDYATRKSPFGKIVHGAVLGCYQDYINDWAGNIGNMWRGGVAVLDNVEEGNFDFRWVSIDSLKKEYA